MDEAPAPPPSPADSPSKPYAQQMGGGFVEAHRQKIFLGLSVAGTLLLGPFAVNNFFQDRVLVGIASVVFVACLLANAFAIARDRPAVVPASVLFFAGLLGLATAMYNNGLIGILWVYPGILLFHFVLPRRMANLYNVTLVLLAIPMAWMHLGPAMMLRVAVTLVLLIIFANIFSNIADVQQAKEAEQRERLDALVRQLEAQNTALREAFRLREEVERIARHDLKTPLASIASVPRLLRERRRLDPREDELVGMVERAALRVLSMVNQSLDLYRMEEGTYRLRPEAVDLGALVRTVARELQAHADSKQLRLVLDLPPVPVCAQGEELLCYSTVANLLKNALEASPDGAEVHVTVREGDGDTALLAMRNRGELPPAVRDSFFAKYATHGKPDGTGLGAYSARLMARVQHGELQVVSDGGATTLVLRLPLWRAAAPALERSGAFTVQQPGAQPDPLPALSVLLADDDEYNVIVLKSLLPSPPLAVRTAVNGRAAIEAVRQARPDIVFMDIEMPVMGGVEALAGIRAWQQAQGQAPSKVVAFTAHDDEATRQRCIEAGFDLYLAKPASREEVLAVLRGEHPAAVQAGPEADGRVQVDPALLDSMPLFLSTRRALARELAVAAAGGERDAVRAKAHKLAGSLAMYGFADASRASLDVERAAGAAELGELRRKCDALVEMLGRMEPAAPPAI